MSRSLFITFKTSEHNSEIPCAWSNPYKTKYIRKISEPFIWSSRAIPLFNFFFLFTNSSSYFRWTFHQEDEVFSLYIFKTGVIGRSECCSLCCFSWTLYSPNYSESNEYIPMATEAQSLGTDLSRALPLAILSWYKSSISHAGTGSCWGRHHLGFEFQEAVYTVLMSHI